MSKFFRLCSCELTKIMKKKSTKVMLILLILSLFASAGMAVLTKKMYSITDDIYSSIDYKSSIISEIESLKTEMSEENLDEASKNSIQAQIDAFQLAIDNDVNIYTTYWKTELITNDITNLKRNIYNYKAMGQEDLAMKEQTTVDKLIELLKNDDFNRIY